MTIVEKLSAICSVAPTGISIIGHSGYWTIVEYTIAGVKCVATLIVD